MAKKKIDKTKCAMCGRAMTICDECKIRVGGVKVIPFSEYDALCDELRRSRQKIRLLKQEHRT